MITKITTIQEMTLQAQAIGLYDFLFFKMDKSRDEIFNLIELWAEEFEKTHKNYDWDGDYYDEIDDFLGYRFESIKALRDGVQCRNEKTIPSLRSVTPEDIKALADLRKRLQES